MSAELQTGFTYCIALPWHNKGSNAVDLPIVVLQYIVTSTDAGVGVGVGCAITLQCCCQTGSHCGTTN